MQHLCSTSLHWLDLCASSECSYDAWVKKTSSIKVVDSSQTNKTNKLQDKKLINFILYENRNKVSISILTPNFHESRWKKMNCLLYGGICLSDLSVKLQLDMSINLIHFWALSKAITVLIFLH